MGAYERFLVTALTLRKRKDFGCGGGYSMTDKEIKKALECCLLTYGKRCEECPYENTSRMLYLQRLVAIKCEKMSLIISTALKQRMRGCCKNCNTHKPILCKRGVATQMTNKELKYVNSLKEENERIKTMLMRFVDAVGKLRNIDDVANMSFIPLMTEENQKFIAEIKAEARKEFAERLKEILGVKKFGLIDNLLEEMESESNG